MLITIDTASEACSVGVFENARLLGERWAIPGTGHAELLPVQLVALWTELGLTADAVTQIVVTTGPGSFTGLRIGLAAAKALALASGATLIGVSSLAALACAVAIGADPPAQLATLIDARRGQIYRQSWDWSATSCRYMSTGPACLEAIAACAVSPGRAVAGTGTGPLGLAAHQDILHASPQALMQFVANFGVPLALDSAPDYLRLHDAVASAGPL
jgi:tRNA threonylcarbamoyladenosine biosynthesis protein TsaB